MHLSELVSEGNFIRLVEIFPPALPIPSKSSAAYSGRLDLNLRFEQLAEGISRIENLADAFSLPELKDGNRIHLNSIGIASELKKLTGNEVIPTLTLRDSNRQNLLSSISFAIFSRLENILIVRGDPYSRTKTDDPMNVYDIAKVSDLVSAIRHLESGIESDQKICILSPINLLRAHEKKYVAMIKERESSGVDIFLAEQMFEDFEIYISRLVEIRKSGITKPIIHNVFPFKSYMDAQYCLEKFGWKISAQEFQGLKENGPRYGLEMARKRYRSLITNRDTVQGVSISTRGNPEVARYIVN